MQIVTSPNQLIKSIALSCQYIMSTLQNSDNTIQSYYMKYICVFESSFPQIPYTNRAFTKAFSKFLITIPNSIQKY